MTSEPVPYVPRHFYIPIAGAILRAVAHLDERQIYATDLREAPGLLRDLGRVSAEEPAAVTLAEKR